MADRPDQLIGTGEVAARFGWSIAGIKKLSKIGVLPPARRIAGRRVWEEGQLPLIEDALRARRTRRRLEKDGMAA